MIKTTNFIFIVLKNNDKMNIDDELWKIDFIEAYNHYNAGEYEKALLKINKVLSFDKNNINALNIKANSLIESWNGDPKTEQNIFDAIDYLKVIIEKDPANRKIYSMTLGNAFHELANYAFVAEGKLNPEIINYLETAKRYFQESLSICEDQPAVWINKGNVLDYLGRHFESLYCYDKAILLNPQHYNAWVNRGICCLTLSRLVENEGDKNKLYEDALIYLAIELELYPSFEIDDFYKKLVNDFIQQNKIEINLETTLKEQLPKKRTVVEERFNLYSKQEKSFKDFYFNFCEMHNLFLNTHFDCNNCGCSTLDLIDVKFTCGINDYIRPYEFFKRWYALIDDYKTARFYIALSQYRHPDFLFMDKPRYESDYSLNYYSNVEILKSALSIAFNIYDKVAFLLNDYKRLGIKDKDVSFWGKDSIFTKKSDLLKDEEYNKNLVALFSIKKEIENKEFIKVKDIRNSIVHRYFVLHDLIDFGNSNYNMNIQEFFESTLYMLLQIKNILFSLTFFISEKENCKKEIEEKNGKIIPTLEWEHNWENYDEITKIAKETEKELNEATDELFSSIFKIISKELEDNEK
jgi:tetratricopeptide (TPR) repeat protein